MGRKNGVVKVRRAELAQLTIKVSPGFKHKLVSYIATVGETAGAYLERQARRDLDEKAQRIAAAWTAAAPTLPFPGPDPAELDPAA